MSCCPANYRDCRNIERNISICRPSTHSGRQQFSPLEGRDREAREGCFINCLPTLLNRLLWLAIISF